MTGKVPTDRGFAQSGSNPGHPADHSHRTNHAHGINVTRSCHSNGSVR